MSIEVGPKSNGKGNPGFLVMVGAAIIAVLLVAHVKPLQRLTGTGA